MSNTIEGPLIYIIDDDEELRLSLDGVFRSVGLKAGLSGSAKDFLEAKRPDILSCLVVDVRLPGISGLAFQDQAGEKRRFRSDHSDDWPRRHTNDGAGNEGEGRRFPGETVP